MKCTVFFALALACCLGVALANWGYGGATYVPVYPRTGRSGVGNGSFLGLIGLLFLLLVLFGSGTGSTSDQIVLINSTLEG